AGCHRAPPRSWTLLLVLAGFFHGLLSRTLKASCSVALQEGEDVRGVLLRLLERRPVAAVVEEYQARVGDVVQDGDAHLESDHPIVSAVDEEHRRLDAGERGRVVVGDAHGLP